MQRRKSQQREKILRILRETTIHPTADWIYQRLKNIIPGLSLGTVYRNLKVLEEDGQIQKLPCGSTHDRYDGDVSPHYHIRCESCGRVDDIPMSLASELNQSAEKVSSYAVFGHRIEFFGLCKCCQKTE
ncbi:MAG: Fur family transcriptional regulator [Chitinivibrionales bacterium]